MPQISPGIVGLLLQSMAAKADERTHRYDAIAGGISQAAGGVARGVETHNARLSEQLRLLQQQDFAKQQQDSAQHFEAGQAQIGRRFAQGQQENAWAETQRRLDDERTYTGQGNEAMATSMGLPNPAVYRNMAPANAAAAAQFGVGQQGQTRFDAARAASFAPVKVPGTTVPMPFGGVQGMPQSIAVPGIQRPATFKDAQDRAGDPNVQMPPELFDSITRGAASERGDAVQLAIQSAMREQQDRHFGAQQGRLGHEHAEDLAQKKAAAAALAAEHGADRDFDAGQKQMDRDAQMQRLVLEIQSRAEQQGEKIEEGEARAILNASASVLSRQILTSEQRGPAIQGITDTYLSTRKTQRAARPAGPGGTLPPAGPAPRSQLAPAAPAAPAGPGPAGKHPSGASAEQVQALEAGHFTWDAAAGGWVPPKGK